MNVLNRNDLIAEVAVRHKVLLDEKDPILVTLTLSELVLGRYVEKVNELGEEHQKALAAALAEQLALAKETGGRIITDASSYVSDEIRKTLDSVLAKAAKSIQQDIAMAQAASRAAADTMQAANALRSNVIAASVGAGVAAFVALVAMIVVLVK
jgi:hypothetical protein